jgi:hypothetical protein
MFFTLDLPPIFPYSLPSHHGCRDDGKFEGFGRPVKVHTCPGFPGSDVGQVWSVLSSLPPPFLPVVPSTHRFS